MKRVLVFAFAVGAISASHASVTNYTSALSWNTAVDYFQTISFTSQADGTALSNQYSGAGVNFDGATFVLSDPNFSDNKGIDETNGNPGPITITFNSAITAFATDFPGAAQYQLFSGSTLVGTSDQFGSAGTGFFGGVISSVAFDKVVIADWTDNTIFVDNIHYGAGTAAPEPMSMLALGLGASSLLIRRRRKSA